LSTQLPKKTYDAIENSFTRAGFPANAINVDPLPTDLIPLGTNGAFLGFGSRNSNLTIAETDYLFTPDTGYFSLLKKTFPYVRLTPTFEFLYSGQSIRRLSSWIPNVNQSQSVPPKSVYAASEYTYEPHLWNAVEAVTVALTKALATSTPTLKWTIYPQTAMNIDDFGERYIFEHAYAQHGGGSTRDANYYNWHPGLVPKYGTLNFSVVVGLRHESPAWELLGKATPHAVFWNLVYDDSSNVGALEKFNNLDTTVQHYNSLPLSAGAADPLGVIWVRPVGVTATTVAGITLALEALGLKVPIDQALADVNPLTVLHHIYVNPDTGVAPWTGSIVAPIQIHCIGVPAA